MQKLLTIDHIGIHGKLDMVRTDKGELLIRHAKVLFTECGFAMETEKWTESEKAIVAGIIEFAKEYHDFIPPEFKRCPFCGQIPELKESHGDYCIVCDCGCGIGLFPEKWDAVTAWNSRSNKRG